MPVQAVSASVSLLLLSAYVQAEAFTPVLSEHATLTVPHVIAPVQSAVPDNVMLAAVAAHANPVVVSVPEHVALAAVTCTTSVPSEFRLTVSVTVTVPTDFAVVHVPTSGLLLPELLPPHPAARTAIAADAATPQLSIINGPSCLQTNGFLSEQDEHGKRNGATGRRRGSIWSASCVTRGTQGSRGTPCYRLQPCCGDEHSGGVTTQLRSLQFLPESIVWFMRRGVCLALAPHAGTPRRPPHGCVPRAAGAPRVAGPRAHRGCDRPCRSRPRPASDLRTRRGAAARCARSRRSRRASSPSRCCRAGAGTATDV